MQTQGGSGLGALIVLAAGYYGVQTSARLGTLLGAAEIAVFLVLAVFLVVHAGSHNTWSVFGTSHTPSAYKGITGVFAGSVFTILAFGGFEGAAPLAEEARDPRRTVQRTVLLAIVFHSQWPNVRIVRQRGRDCPGTSAPQRFHVAERSLVPISRRGPSRR